MTAGRATSKMTAGRGFTRTAVPFLLLLAAVVLVDVIRVVECRTVRDSQIHLKQQQKRAALDTNDTDGSKFQDEPQADGATDSEDDSAISFTPVITSTPMQIEANEGSTTKLPCDVTQGSLDEFNLLWINGTKTIMTDGDVSTPNTRIKQSKSPLSKTLSIEGVTRWDSGSYTCKITSAPPVEVTHTLIVIHPPKILSLKAVGAVETTTSKDQKKFNVKEGEPVQLICKVDGYPEPKMNWIKRTLPTTIPQSQNQNPDSPQQLPWNIVSNTNEYRIDSANSLIDAGHYECVEQNKQGKDSLPNSALELIIEYPPTVTVSKPVVNTGETYTAQLECHVRANPKVKVTWEKEQINENGSSSFMQLHDRPTDQYDIFSSKDNTLNNTVPGSYLHVLKVKQVQGQKDFGHYRCKAENKFGLVYSEYITLTGTPASPQHSRVNFKSGFPELEWTVDSWSPMIEYQLQFRRQQDPSSLWIDVRPQPKVVNPSLNSKTADEHRFTVSYVFGENNQQQQSAGGSTYEQLTLQRGTTYVARIRAYNQHGWSDWSKDVVFSGVNINEGSNEIIQNGQADVSKASVGGSSGASRVQQLQYCGATTVLAIALAVASYC